MHEDVHFTAQTDALRDIETQRPDEAWPRQITAVREMEKIIQKSVISLLVPPSLNGRKLLMTCQKVDPQVSPLPAFLQ